MGWFNRDKKISTGSPDKSVERSEEVIRKLLADGEAAKKIVNEYGGVLEITSKMMTFGAPQSLLPHPKGKIKQAIMTYLLYRHLTETLDEEFFNALEVGYASLANFLDDADARVAVAAQADFDVAIATTRGVPNSEDITRMAERMSSPKRRGLRLDLSAALERREKSTEEFKTLSEEFHAVAVKMGIPYAKTPDQQKEVYAQVATRLGLIYSSGLVVPKDDVAATSWFRKAAEQGDAMGQHLFGAMYLHGFGVPQDDKQAVLWYRKAADQGDASAQFDLGNMYHQGKGVSQDDAEAAKWYRKVADQGDARAQYNLGSMYAKGEGVSQDYPQAHKWFNLAASRLTDAKMRAQAVSNRDGLTKLMTPSQVAEAQRQVAEWRPTRSGK